MKKVFIFSICSTCGEPIGIVDPCELLGYNSFPETNFHGELSIKETEEIRQDLILLLKKDGKLDDAKFVEYNTKVFEIAFI